MKIHALEIASELGFRIFPVNSPAQGPKANGKQPLIRGWQDAASADPATIEAWWDRWPKANIGIATGLASGVWVLDVDVKKEDGFASLRELRDEVGDFAETMTAKSGSGGLHFYFRYLPGDNIRNRTGIKPGIDIRGDGGYIVAPPSLHESGKHYEWIRR